MAIGIWNAVEKPYIFRVSAISYDIKCKKKKTLRTQFFITLTFWKVLDPQFLDL